MTLKAKIVEMLERMTSRKHNNVPWRFAKADGYRLGSKAEAVMVVDYLLDIRKLYMVKSRRRAACLEDVKQVVRERIDTFFETHNGETGRPFAGVVIVFDKEAPINKCIGSCGRGRESARPVATPVVAGIDDPVQRWRWFCEHSWNHFETDKVNWSAHCSNVDFKMFIVDYISAFLRDEYRVPLDDAAPRFLVNYGPLPGVHDFYKTATSLIMLHPERVPPPLDDEFASAPDSEPYKQYHRERVIRENWQAHFQEADAAVGFWAFGLWYHDVYVNSADGDVFLALLLSSYMRLHVDGDGGDGNGGDGNGGGDGRPDAQITDTSVRASFINEVFWIRNDTLGHYVSDLAGQQTWEEHGYTVDINRCCVAIWRLWYKMLTKPSPLDFVSALSRAADAMDSVDKKRNVRSAIALSMDDRARIAQQVIEGAIESFVVLCCLCGNDYVESLGFGPQIVFSAYFERTRCMLVYQKKKKQQQQKSVRNECKGINIDVEAFHRLIFDIFYHKYASTTTRADLKQSLIRQFPNNPEKQFPSDQTIAIMYGNTKWCLRNWIKSAFGGHTTFTPDPVKRVVLDDRQRSAKYGWVLESDDILEKPFHEAMFALATVDSASISNTYARKGKMKARRPF